MIGERKMAQEAIKTLANMKPEGKETVTRTSEEAAIVSRIMAESQDWKNIKESEVDDFKLANDPMELPEPAKAKRLKQEFAFRWISRSPGRMDEMRNKPVPFRWWICNSVNTPFLEGFFDPVLGCVSKLDQMLVFKPFWMFEKEQGFKRQLADGKDASGDLKKKDGMQKDGGTFVAGRPIGAGDVVVADSTVDPRIDNYAEAAEE